MNRRRFLVTSLVGALAAPLVAEAQQAAKIARIGWLGDKPAGNPHLREAFLQGLRDLGYVEGRNLVIEYRSAEGKYERFPARAAELVALKGRQGSGTAQAGGKPLPGRHLAHSIVGGSAWEPTPWRAVHRAAGGAEQEGVLTPVSPSLSAGRAPDLAGACCPRARHDRSVAP
jgi:hypothetical protein